MFIARKRDDVFYTERSILTSLFGDEYAQCIYFASFKVCRSNSHPFIRNQPL